MGEGKARLTRRRMSVMSAIAGVVEARMEEVKQELLGVFRDQLDSMLQEIASDYGLELGELQEKYQVVSSTPAPPKKAVVKRVKKATSDSEGERVKCEARTAKGAPCKNFALAGSTFCACHNKDNKEKKGESKVEKIKRTAKKQKSVDVPSEDEGECSRVNDTPRNAKGKEPVKVPAAPKKAVVKHNHPMDFEEHSDCRVCQTLGNAATSMTDNTEDPVVQVSEDMKKVLDTLFDSDDDGDWSGTEDDGEDVEESMETLG